MHGVHLYEQVPALPQHDVAFLARSTGRLRTSPLPQFPPRLHPSNSRDAPQTLGLASLSLATKSTESPRRLREFLVPAHAVLRPTAAPLTFPSARYDALRASLVAAELTLLRVLRFDIRLDQPLDYVPRLLARALALPGTEHLDGLAAEDRAEAAVVDVDDSVLAAAVRAVVRDAVTDYRLVSLFTARTVAAACFRVAAEGLGLLLFRRAPNDDDDDDTDDDDERRAWLGRLTAGRVEFGDFEEAVERVRLVVAAQRVV